jgi:protein-S-isoprenylcysteine O-methyltransferase Ste14
MRAAVVMSFFLWAAAFVVVMNVVGKLRHARNLRGVTAYPLFEIYRSVALALLTVGLYTMRHASLASFEVVREAGFAAVGLGIIVSAWAQYSLGRNWTGRVGLHNDHELVVKGAYKRVRNPMYLGMWISMLGLCAVTLNVFYAVGALIWAFSFTLLIPWEEQKLQKRFKDAYALYRSRTGVLLPRFRDRD